jgi:hypothetical protein
MNIFRQAGIAEIAETGAPGRQSHHEPDNGRGSPYFEYFTRHFAIILQRYPESRNRAYEILIAPPLETLYI